ncbi:MAG: T9SS type A sorting domain-containing protein [Rhodothermales bacterium]|nr:T9SS type A sorting domain-containing protein [Rhodothermales bacterium]
MIEFRQVHLLILVVLIAAISDERVYAQAPTSLAPGVSVRFVGASSPGSVRIDYDPALDRLVYLTPTGSLFAIDSPFIGQGATQIYSSADHGLSNNVLGFSIGSGGVYYVVGNQSDGGTTLATIMRGEPDGSGSHNWTTLAETEPYPRSATPFDHLFNGIIESPDGDFVYINSGSRTDHGEEQNTGGQFPGMREIPITSAILRLPSDTLDARIWTNEDSLHANGYLFADGVRNSFDLAFDAEGRLFATENSGDRDDSEEINWIREGHHYGFPWRLGTNDTPQQFDTYDPSSDLLINAGSYSASNGFFYNDPDYPEPPAGIVFTDPIRNLGPDANMFRDASDGLTKDADDEGVSISTLTPHRSPLGLVFDVDQMLAGEFAGDAFVLSWTGSESNLLSPFGDDAEDLLHLSLTQSGDNFDASVDRIVAGFDNPIDAVQVADKIYVLEYGGGQGIWEISFADPTGVEADPEAVSPALRFYPNPTNGEGTLEIDNSIHLSRIIVYDVMGRRVQHIDTGSRQGTRVDMDLSALSEGLYFVVVSGSGKIESLPILITR